jgi:NAD-dependent dihydropyrimidine dehydrogenase PreA subunit
VYGIPRYFFSRTSLNFEPWLYPKLKFTKCLFCLLFFFMFFIFCSENSENSSIISPKQIRVDIDIPDDGFQRPDIYRISIKSSGSDSESYYDFGKKNKISLSIPGNAIVRIIVDGFSSDGKIVLKSDTTFDPLQISSGTSVLSLRIIRAPVRPDSVSIGLSAEKNPVITWSKSKNADSYIIYRNYNVASEPVPYDSTLNLSYTDTAISKGLTVYYRIVAVNSIGFSDSSDFVSIYVPSDIPIVAPDTPTGILTTEVTSSSIKITFNSVTSATSYNLLWSIDTTFLFTSISLSSPSYIHSGLKSGTTYYYKVSALNGTQESNFSPVFSAKTNNVSVKIAKINSNCNGCGRCFDVCQQKAISKVGSVYIIDPAKCNGCGLCLTECPFEAIDLTN